MNFNQSDSARQLIACMDLTSLNEDDTPDKITALCQKAITPYGKVAAVCIYPRFVKQAATLLKDSGIKIATVANFPHGHSPLDQVLEEIDKSIQDGAQEIDVVFPYFHFLQSMLHHPSSCGLRHPSSRGLRHPSSRGLRHPSSRGLRHPSSRGLSAGSSEPSWIPRTSRGTSDDASHGTTFSFLSTCKEKCGDKILLKVILETGAIKDLSLITLATQNAILAGADFVKTSTGKIPIGATLEAAETMLQTIKTTKKTVGLKVAGGIREPQQALQYWTLTQKIMGQSWVTPQTFRLGTSRLLEML